MTEARRRMALWWAINAFAVASAAAFALRHALGLA